MKLKSEAWRIIYFFQHELTWTNLKLRKDYEKRLKALKDLHRGKRCFIIGNGPSLKAEDLEMLKT
jgi:uncharacterized Rossmann fold enzyme